MIFLIKLVGFSKYKKINLNSIFLMFFIFFLFYIIIGFLVNFFIVSEEVFFISDFFLNFDISLFNKIGSCSTDLLYIKNYFYGIFFIYFIILTLILLLSMVGYLYNIISKKK